MRGGFDLSNPDELVHEFHIHLHADSEHDRKANLWACIAASAHTVSYDYRRVLHFIEWANAYQFLTFRSTDWVPLPTPDAIEYLEILEFRCRSLEEARRVSGKEWDWPTQWGHVHWNCPVSYSAQRAFNDPGRTSPPLEHVIAETLEAIVVQKREMGHRARIVLSTTERLLASEMVNLFVGSPDFPEIPSLPPIYGSLDTPPQLASNNTDNGGFDVDGLLGEYSPGRNCEIVLYERGLRHCAKRLNLPTLALRELTLVHELAHWIADQLPLRRSRSIGNHERWSDLRLETAGGSTTFRPSRLEQTEKDVHEGWAQLLTFYSLLMAYDDRVRNSIAHPSLEGYMKHDGRGCLFTFLELNDHQSGPYRVWQDIVRFRKNPREVVGTLPALRLAEPGATMQQWRDLLKT